MGRHVPAPLKCFERHRLPALRQGLVGGVVVETEGLLRTADGIIRNNLAPFEKDGRASYAYIYPASVNGRKGSYKDPYANDQDWGLADLLQLEADSDGGHC